MYRFLLIIVLVGAVCSAHAQLKDIEIWTGSELTYKFNKKLDVSLEEEFRFFDNATRLYEHLTEIQARYDVKKHIRVAMAYRFSQENNRFDQFDLQHRLAADVRYRDKFERLQLTFRLRYQQVYTAYFSSENGKIPNRVLRNKLTLAYDIKNFKGEPFVEYEHFYAFDGNNAMDKYEFSLGMEYKLSKNMDLEMAYAYRLQVWSDRPVNRNIFAVAVNYDL